MECSSVQRKGNSLSNTVSSACLIILKGERVTFLLNVSQIRMFLACVGPRKEFIRSNRIPSHPSELVLQFLN